jgi:ATP-dependent DNA helicase DinG
MLDLCLRTGLTPVAVPEALLTRFTVCMPDALANTLEAAANANGHSLAMTAAMLIAAAQQSETKSADSPNAPIAELVGENAVREALRPLLHQAWKGLQAGKIVFAEAATGTGKGRLIASLAASSVQRGNLTVVTAPLSVLYQQILELRHIQTEVKPLLLLGRANFIDPEKLRERLEDEEHPLLQKWLENGGTPQTPEFKALSEALHVPLRWLAEDALSFNETLNLGDYLLDEGADEDNAAETTYRAAFLKMDELRQDGKTPLILCSHLMLAVDSRLKSLNEGHGGVLPEKIDTLIVDEAHLLERAFATVHTSTIHLYALERRFREAEFPSAVFRALRDATADMLQTLSEITKGKTLTGRLDNFPMLAPKLEGLLTELQTALTRKGRKELSAQAKASRRSLGYARQTLEAALSGYSTLQVSTTPVLHHPLFTCGKDNLDRFFTQLWEQVRACVLTSATLYAPDATGQQSAGHIRWVLGVPKNRAFYLSPVIPAWVYNTADIARLPGSFPPDDSEEWLDQTATQLDKVYRNAKGGTLALCTSYATIEELAKRLKTQYPHLLAQSFSNSATRCAQVFRQQASAGIKPIWLGVGNAWTGIDLADKDVPAQNDELLTDLYIPRIPYGSNRSLTHQRRREALGFMVEVHETARMLKQGLGRLVRREGVRNRHIWLADIRMENPPPPMKPILKLLAPFRKAGS